MSLIKTLTELFESIFKRSSPEVQRKQLQKKMEMEIREFKPLICKDGMLLPNFGEAIYVLYKNTTPLDKLFSVTLNPNDIPRQHRFEAELIMTGYSTDEQQLMDGLSYEARKERILGEMQNPDREYMRQRKELERILKALNTENFKKMDADILNLRQFVEFCHYGFLPFLQAFDSNFNPSDIMYQPKYVEMPVTKALNLLEDLYFQLSGLTISTTTAEAIIAVAKLRKGGELSETEYNNYMGNIKKINYVKNKILQPEKLKMLIRMCHNDFSYEPQVAKYTGSPRQDFANMLQQRFDLDEQKIKTEIQNETISDAVAELFSNLPLEEVGSYNQTYNTLLQTEVSMSFKWILPLRIMKTFLKHYVPSGVKALLNDIVIEGFFNNPSYKTTVSTVVYSAINADEELQAFEASFGADQRNSIAVLESYIKDSKKDKDFYKRLEKMVVTINNDAHNLLQAIATNLLSLSRLLGELLADAKKPSSEIIQNLKVLMMSSRNRDNTNFIEAEYDKWAIFFDIMKNYVIINTGEINHE